MAEIGIVCGMVSEVETLGQWVDDPQIAVGVSGARPDRAEEIAARLISERGVRLLISWGIAGGLDPGLAPGDLLFPGQVADGTTVLPLASKLLRHPDHLSIAGVDQVVAGVDAKSKLRKRTGAVAVDMETHRVARAAAGRVPCLAVRAISDPADRALPALAAGALDADGRPRIGHVIAGLARRPWQLAGLLAAKRDSDTALAALSGVADEVFGNLLKAEV